MTSEELNAKAARNGPIIVAAEEVLSQVLDMIAKGERQFDLPVFKGFSVEDFTSGQNYVHRKLIYMLNHSGQKVANPTGKYFGIMYVPAVDENGYYQISVHSYGKPEDWTEEDEKEHKAKFDDAHYESMLKGDYWKFFDENAIDILV